MTEVTRINYQTEKTSKLGHVIEAHINGHSARVEFHQKGAQVISTIIDGVEILLTRKPPLRALSENIEDDFGEKSIDSTGEGGTWPAGPAGRSSKGDPIHGFAPLNIWRVTKENENSVTMRTGGRDSSTFAEVFPEDVMSMERTVQIVEGKDGQPHTQYEIVMEYEGKRNPLSQPNQPSITPDMAEHLYLSGDIETSSVLVNGHLIPMGDFMQTEELTEFHEGQESRKTVHFLNRGISADKVTTQPGVVAFVRGDGKVVVITSEIVVTEPSGEKNYLKPVEYILYRKPGSHKSVCIEPMSGQFKLPPKSTVSLLTDINVYNSVEEFQKSQAI